MRAADVPRPIRILELRCVRGTGGGPEKTILQGTARTDPRRFAITVCYIRDARDRAFTLDQAAARLPIEYVEITERHSFDPSIWPALRRLVRERQIDIVHAHDYKTDFLALALARVEKTIALSTAHGWVGVSPRERLVYYPADRAILRAFPRVIAVSSDIRRRLVGAGVREARVVTVPNGIDPDLFRRVPDAGASARRTLNLPGSASVVGAIGRLEGEKRFDVLIDAVATLRATRPTLRLVIVGDGSLAATLAAHAASRGVSDICTFTGQRTDVREIAQAFDVLVQSSVAEGTPNVVLEAMALEIPIVATAAGGTGDLITHEVHGLLVPLRDAGALGAAVARTLDDRSATDRRVAAARRRIEQELSFAARMQAVERVYEELMGTAATGAPRLPVVEAACEKP